jgi:hypothetical protein
MCSPKSLHNLQHDEGDNYMAEAEAEVTNRESKVKQVTPLPYSP